MQIEEVALPEVSADDFSRRFALRNAGLMWFLGAGVSATAGIPTAWDMLWEFKRNLFVSQRRVSLRSVEDLSNSAVRSLLQSHINSLGNLPVEGADDEYAALFEAVYPSEIDRRTYIDSKVSGAKPSYGHVALACLLNADCARLVWTTNFDPLVEDACAKVYGATGPLTLITLNSADMASQQISVGRWPIEVKIHGDFRSRRLKNTGDELRHQDELLRRALVDCCRRWGIVVAGYSGRDLSVMEALNEALEAPGAFPSGLFWMHRGTSPPHPTVANLLKAAKSRGIEAGLVRIENFDEAMRDLIRVMPSVDTAHLDSFAENRQIWTPAPIPTGNVGWPVLRLNALPVEGVPTVCRRIACEIGGGRDIRAAIDEAGVDVIAARSSHGVLAFGSDTSVKAVFSKYKVSEFDLHSIDVARLRFDSAERGLLRAAMTRAIARHYGMNIVHRRRKDLLFPKAHHDLKWDPLKRIIGSLKGTLPGKPSVNWHEGIAICLEWACDSLWLVVDPLTIVDQSNQDDKVVAAEFARERTATRYNGKLNALLDFWGTLLSSDQQLRALGVGDGVDAAFNLGKTTGFSRRLGA